MKLDLAKTIKLELLNQMLKECLDNYQEWALNDFDDRDSVMYYRTHYLGLVEYLKDKIICLEKN